jgi:hypothetical protein
MVLQPMANLLYIRLFYPEGKMLIQSPPQEGWPVPNSLTWSEDTLSWTANLGRLPGPVTLGLAVGWFLLFAYFTLRVLNRTFRVTTGVNWDAHLLLKTYMHTPPMIKAFLIGTAAVIPLWITTALLGRLFGGFFVQALRAALVGAAVWILFSREGVAGDFDDGNYLLPSQRSVRLRLAAKGAVFGILTAFAVWASRSVSAVNLLEVARGLGGIGEARLMWIARLSVGTAAVCGAALGGLLVALGREELHRIRRLQVGLPYAVVLGCACFYALRTVPTEFSTRLDYKPKTDVNTRLQQALKTTSGTDGMRTVLVLDDGRTGVLPMDRTTSTGLPANAAVLQKTEEFLQRRNYLTTLSDELFRTAVECAAVDLNLEALNRLAWLQLTHCPQTESMRLFFDRVLTGPVTSELQQYLRQLALSKSTGYPNRDSYERMADVLLAAGLPKEAEPLYRRGGVPETRLPELRAARSRMLRGSVSGTLLWKDRPLAGVRVGLMPARALGAIDMLNDKEFVRPVWLRYAAGSAVTDASGKFEIKPVVMGEYRLIAVTENLNAPPGVKEVSSTSDPRLQQILVWWRARRVDLGEIRIHPGTTPKPKAPTEAP